MRTFSGTNECLFMEVNMDLGAVLDQVDNKKTAEAKIARLCFGLD